jgi:RimJ/RimL family protein N-acetyltransferase
VIVTGPHLAAWVYEPFGGAGGNSKAIGWEKDGKIINGFAVESCNGQNCYVHIRLDGYVPREFWFAMVDWVYNQLGCERMTAPVAASNEKCLKLLNHIGFDIEATLEKAAYDGGDLHFLRWWKKDCYMLNWKRREAQER